MAESDESGIKRTHSFVSSHSVGPCNAKKTPEEVPYGSQSDSLEIYDDIRLDFDPTEATRDEKEAEAADTGDSDLANGHIHCVIQAHEFEMLPIKNDNASTDSQGVTLEGSGGLTVQQLLETPGLIQSTVTIAGGPPTATSTSHQGTQLSSAVSSTTISEGVSLDEDDVFQCGRCKKQFSSLDVFMMHKRDQCSGKTGSLRVLQGPQESQSSSSSNPHAGFQDESTSLASQIHVQVQPTPVPVSSGYSGSDLPSPSNINQHIIVNESELLPFTIENAQVLPLPGGLQTANFLPASTGNKTLSSAVSPLLTTTANISTPLDVGSSLSPPQTLTTIVGVEDAGDGSVRSGDAVSSQEVTGEKDDVACYNHEFFHGGMAKTAPSKNDPLKLKPKHKCQFCGKEFSKNFDLQQHIRSHTGEKPFQCIVCGRAFTQKSNVKKHMATHRVWPSGSLSDTLPKDPIKKLVMTPSIDIVPQMELLEEPVVKEEVLVDDSYVCQFCGISLSTYMGLRTHMKLHAHQKVYKCIQKNCDLSFDDLDSFLDHIRTHDRDLQYRCHTCSKVFSSLNTLGFHQYEHSMYPQPKKTVGPSYFRCTKCMNKYASAEALEHHLKTASHHYPCKQCMKVFTSERLLRRHLHIHVTVNLFTCAQCSKGFKSDYALKLHQLIHTGEKPFECTLCRTAFNRRDKLKRHMLIHGPKKFKCPFTATLHCVREFNRPDKLRVHMMTHAAGRGRRGKARGRGRGRGINTGRSDRQIKKESDSVEEVKCSLCDQPLPSSEEVHKCAVIKAESASLVKVEIEDQIHTGNTGKSRSLRQTVARKVQDYTNSRRGSTNRRRGISQQSHPSHRQLEEEQEKQQNEQEQQNGKQLLEPQEIQPSEENILTVPLDEDSTETGGDADTQNVEIIYIPFSLPLTRPIQAELIRAMSSEEGHVSSEILEGGTTITLDGNTSSLLVSNSTMVPLVDANTVEEDDPLENATMKESQDLQVIYNPATTQLDSSTDSSQLVETDMSSQIHNTQLGEVTIEEPQLPHTHLTHLSILPQT